MESDLSLEVLRVTEDALGTKLHKSYIDVFLPTADLPKLDAACASLGLKAVGVGVVPYSGSMRRVRLTEVQS